jgi:hypothetical protein
MFNIISEFFKKLRELPDQEEVIKRRYRVAANPIEEAGTVDDYDEYERKEGPGLGMSMLDIISCGLGAVTLVAVLHMIIKIPLPPPLSKDFILAEIRMKGSAVIGFAIKHDQTDWFYIHPNISKQTSERIIDPITDQNMAVKLDYSNSYEGCTRDQEKDNCTHTIAHLHIEQPAIGNWHIEPYLFSYRSENDIPTIDEIGLVTCLYWTRKDDFTDTRENCNNDKNFVSADSQVQVHSIAIEIKK